MPGCAVKKCGNNSSIRVCHNGRPVTFHQFPADEKRKEIWAEALRKSGKTGKNDEKWTPNRNSKICSVHFEETQIERTTVKNSKQMTKLKIDAVPSIFPNPEEKRSKNKTKDRQQKSVLLPEQPLPCSASSAGYVKDEDLLDKAVAGLDLSDSTYNDVDVVFRVEQTYDVQGNASNLLSLDAVAQIPAQLLCDDPVETKPSNETRKMVIMPLEEGGETIIFPNSGVTLKAKPFVPSEAEQQAGPSKTDEEDDDACCGGFTDLDSSLCSSVKGGKAEDLAQEFRSGMEALQAVQIKLYNMMPPERLKKFGTLLTQLSMEGREMLKEVKVLTDQIRLLKRYEPAQVSDDDAKRQCGSLQNEGQAEATIEISAALDQFDVQLAFDLDAETWKVLLESIYMD